MRLFDPSVCLLPAGMKCSFFWNRFQLFLLSETPKCLHDLKELFPAVLAGQHSSSRCYNRYLSTFPCFGKGYYSRSSFTGRVHLLLKIFNIFSCYFWYLFRNCQLAACYLRQTTSKAGFMCTVSLKTGWAEVVGSERCLGVAGTQLRLPRA